MSTSIASSLLVFAANLAAAPRTDNPGRLWVWPGRGDADGSGAATLDVDPFEPAELVFGARNSVEDDVVAAVDIDVRRSNLRFPVTEPTLPCIPAEPVLDEAFESLTSALFALSTVFEGGATAVAKADGAGF